MFWHKKLQVLQEKKFAYILKDIWNTIANL